MCKITLKHSFKQLIRTPLRTGLFILFLAAVTAFLCFGLYMWVSVGKSLDQAEGSFTTAGFIEFLSPHSKTYSDVIFDSPYVEFRDHSEWLGVYGDGLEPTTPARSVHANGIIVIEPLAAASGEFTPIEVIEILASGQRLNTNIVRIKSPDLLLEPGKQYIAAGSYNEESDAFFPENTLDFDPVAEIPGGNLEEFFSSDPGQPWAGLRETFPHSDNRLTGLTTKDLDIIYAFHQGDAVLVKGRSFTQEEYEQSARVCLVSVAFADSNNLQPGDRIDLSFYEVTGLSGSSDTGVCAMFSSFSQPISDDSYEIIGMYTTMLRATLDLREYYYQIDKDTIIMPRDPLISITKWGGMENLVSCRLTNGTAEAFLAEMEAADLSDISITVYDQGYGKVTNALAGMGKTAQILMGICLGTGLVLILLFAFLYVGRQKRSIAIMYSLGTSRRRALGYLAATVGIVAVFAVVLGGLAGYVFSDSALESVYQRMLEGNAAGLGYSTVAAGSEIQYQVIIPPGFGLPAAAAGAILLMTLALSAVFSINVLGAEPLQLLSQKED